MNMEYLPPSDLPKWWIKAKELEENEESFLEEYTLPFTE